MADVEFGAVKNNVTGLFHPAIWEHVTGECLISQGESYTTVLEASDRAEEIFIEIAQENNILVSSSGTTH